MPPDSLETPRTIKPCFELPGYVNLLEESYFDISDIEKKYSDHIGRWSEGRQLSCLSNTFFRSPYRGQLQKSCNTGFFENRYTATNNL